MIVPNLWIRTFNKIAREPVFGKLSINDKSKAIQINFNMDQVLLFVFSIGDPFLNPELRRMIYK